MAITGRGLGMAEPDTEPNELSLRAAEAAANAAEADRPQDRNKIVSTFTRSVTAGARAAGRGTRAAQRGAGSTTRAARSTTRAARRRVGSGSAWLADQVIAMAPRLRVRDQDALRAQFPGRSADEIADALIEGAARASAAAGGAAGVASALPVLPAFPAEVVGETLVVVGIEIKLIAELHEAYGMPAQGKFTERMSAYVAAWAHRRGVSVIPGGVIFAAGSPLTRLLRRRLAARAGRSAVSLGPLLTGAAAGAVLNGRETRKLGRAIQKDLSRRALTGPPDAAGALEG